jgi:hypothetical protein
VRQHTVTPVVNEHLLALDAKSVDGRMAAVLLIAVDLDRMHRQHERSSFLPAGAIGDAVLYKRFAAISESSDLEFNVSD